MTAERLFIDTAYVQALLNKKDNYHNQAQAVYPRLAKVRELWTTEAILVEIGNALSSINRVVATGFINICYNLPNMTVVAVDTSLLKRSIQLYENRHDKEWGLTDCISFVVMQEQGLFDALTMDHHFKQAGFHPIMEP